MFTEYQAWKFLAEEFHQAYTTKTSKEYTPLGLCYSIGRLYRNYAISWNIRNKMFDRIGKYADRNDKSGYFWATTLKYANNRAKLASNFAGSIKRKSDARKMAKAK